MNAGTWVLIPHVLFLLITKIRGFDSTVNQLSITSQLRIASCELRIVWSAGVIQKQSTAPLHTPIRAQAGFNGIILRLGDKSDRY
jgi:hypothetical protein